jgi:hypothetical protein
MTSHPAVEKRFPTTRVARQNGFPDGLPGSESGETEYHPHSIASGRRLQAFNHIGDDG